MRWIVKLKELINSEFNSGWIELLIPSEASQENFKKEIEKKEFELLPKVYEYLNFSILEGEYINDPDVFKQALNEIYSKISNLQSPIINNDPDYSYTSVLDQYQFFYSIKKSLELYKRVATRVAAQIYNPEKTFVIDFASNYIFEGHSEYFAKKGNSYEEPLFDLFYENLAISEDGFFLSNNNSQFFDLLKKIDALKNLKSKIDLSQYSFQEIIIVLIEICVFYQRKLIIRKYQDDEKFDQKYLYEHNETNFNLENHKLEKDFLKGWDTYSQNHFLSEKNQERTFFLKRIIEEKLKNLNFECFLTAHSLIKYYKDINTNYDKLNEIKKHLGDFTQKSKFDEFAKNISLGYLLNNYLSKKIENSSKDEMDNIVEEIKKYQDRYSINNFFPYYKICKFLKKKIENDFEETKKTGENNFEEINSNINELKGLFVFYKTKLKWSKSHLNYAYQLPFEECVSKIKIGEEEIEVFIPSTFSLPLNYDKFDSFSDKLNNFLLSCENELKSLENFFTLNKKLAQKEEEINNVLKDQSKRNIELLGIFSAIIALLFQGAYSVNSNVEYEDKLFTLIVMFLVLVSFLLMLRSFYSKKFERDELITIKIVSFLIIPLLLITVIILFNIYK